MRVQAFRCLLQPAASLSLNADVASEGAKRGVAKLRTFVVAACAEAQTHDGYLRKVCALKKAQLKGPATIRAFQFLLGGAPARLLFWMPPLRGLSCPALEPSPAACRWEPAPLVVGCSSTRLFKAVCVGGVAKPCASAGLSRKALR